MQFTNFKGIYDHDAVIWLGDLNYRLSAPLSFEEVVHKCVTGSYASLFHYDQVIIFETYLRFLLILVA